MQRLLDGIQSVFGTWRFPAFMLFALVFVDALTGAMLLVPPSNTGLGAFAEEFKVWCFGYDPATRTMEWGYVSMMGAELLVLGLIIVAVWWRQLADLRRTPRKVAAAATAALVVVAGAAAAFGAIRPARRDAVLPFPAERLRTSFAAPDFTLTDQDGNPLTLSSLRGHPVMVTGVYARCGSTCPMLMRGARDALAALTPAERSDVRAVAITLNPEHDTPPVLAEMARAHHVSAPGFRLVTGDPREVNRALDAFNIARTRNPATGVIDHANVFVLIDRRGRIAWRLSLGSQNRQWLPAALGILARE